MRITNKFKKVSVLILFLIVFISGLFFVLFSTNNTVYASMVNRHFYTKNSDYMVYSPKGQGYLTNINNSNAVVSQSYLIRISDTIIDQIDSGYNHFVIAWGRKDVMDYLYERTAKTEIRNSYFRSHGRSAYVDTEFFLDPDIFEQYFSYSGSYSSLGFVQKLTEVSSDSAPFFCREFDESDVITYSNGFGVGYGLSGSFLNIEISWAENCLSDIGIYCLYQYNTAFSTDTRVVRYDTDNVVLEIQNKVSQASVYSSSVVGAYEKALGIYRGGNTTVNYSYVKMLDGHFNKYETLTGSVSVPSVFIPDKNYIWDRVLSCDYVNGNGLIGFNANYTSYAGYYMENGIINRKETFGSRIIRQATGYTYSYSGGSIPSTVSVNVIYGDYLYSNFFIRVANSNSDYENDLIVDVYPTSVETKGGKYYLYFDYQTIFDLFGNSLHWSVFQDDFNITYNSADVQEHVYVEEETFGAGNKRLAVSFDDGYQGNLFGLEITGTAPITEPVAFDCIVEYIELNDDLSTTKKTFSIGTQVYDNSFGALCATLESPLGPYAEYIYGSINPAVLGGIEYLRPASVLYGSDTVDYTTCTARFVVQYEYSSSVLVISNNVNSEKWTYNLSDGIAEYTLALLGVQGKIPSGYRIKSFESNRLTVIEENKGNPLNSKFIKGDSNKDEPYMILLTLTDTWPVRINYLEQYKNSCFAVMQDYTNEVRVSDYSDIYNLSISEINSILGKDIGVLNFIKKSVRVNYIFVGFDDYYNIYTVNLSYTHLSVKTIDSDGNASETIVGLTPFSHWCEHFGKDWSILYLAPDVFEYSDEVEKDKLYGFFTSAVFKEQIKNFNSWFKNLTDDGCSVVFSQRKIEGSGVYKFLRDSGGLFTAVGATIGVIFGHPIIGAGSGALVSYGLTNLAEVINDDNGEYYTYFFYLDCTSDRDYIAHNGADHYDDHSSSTQNKVEDIWDSVSNWFKSALNFVLNNPVVLIIVIIIAALVIVFVVSLLVKFLRWILGK